jgi:CheY-like chemotaxis protein
MSPKSTILIIDDDQFIRETMQILLRARGYEVRAAESGAAGIDAIRSGSVDLAIVDLFMPGMDGLKVVQTVRQFNSEIPLIMASGFMFDRDCPPMPGFEAMAMEAGAFLTLYKPLRPNDVLAAVQQALAMAAQPASNAATG